MANLFLAPTRKYFGIGDANDFAVLDGGRVIGRIFLSPQGPEGRRRFWTITALEAPPSVHNHGYSAVREEAMAEFKARWLWGIAQQRDGGIIALHPATTLLGSQ